MTSSIAPPPATGRELSLDQLRRAGEQLIELGLRLQNLDDEKPHQAVMDQLDMAWSVLPRIERCLGLFEAVLLNSEPVTG